MVMLIFGQATDGTNQEPTNLTSMKAKKCRQDQLRTKPLSVALLPVYPTQPPTQPSDIIQLA